MSLGEILNTAISGLNAAQSGLRTVSSNIANVDTPGYGRERVSTTTNVLNGRGVGVVVGDTVRVADRFLENAVYARRSSTGSAQIADSYLGRLDSALGEPGASTSLPARLDAIEAAAIGLAGADGGSLDVSRFTDSVGDALTSMQSYAADIEQLRGEAAADISTSLDKTNSLLKQIHELNGDISRVGLGGGSTSGLESQRAAALEELGSMIEINLKFQTDGRVEIELKGGSTLVDRQLRVMYYPDDDSGVAQKDYPPVQLRFADAQGNPGPATGTNLDGPAIGGRIGALMTMRDARLPQAADDIAKLQAGLATNINRAANEATAFPAPSVLEGRSTGLVGSDLAHFTGKAVFAVADAAGTIQARTEVDFDALGAGASINDVLSAINGGLGGRATASLTDGVLTIASANPAEGVVVAPGDPAARNNGGIGFSHFFGLNDVIGGDRTGVGPGLAATDPHGFSTGETAEIVMRDASGRTLGRATMRADDGPSWGEIVSKLNSGKLGAFGTFSVADDGKIAFAPNTATGTVSLAITSDSTNRYGTGSTFTEMSGLVSRDPGLQGATVRDAMRDTPERVPLGQFDITAAVGQRGLGAGDRRGTVGLSEAFSRPVDIEGSIMPATLSAHSARVLGSVGQDRSRAGEALSLAEARQADAVNRRDSFQAVNIDEELAQMVVLQNSYSAAARIVTTANEMYDALLRMTG